MVWSYFSLLIIFCKDATKSALQINVYTIGLRIKADLFTTSGNKERYGERDA